MPQIVKIVENRFVAEALCRRLANKAVSYQFQPATLGYRFSIGKDSEEVFDSMYTSLAGVELPFADIKHQLNLTGDERVVVTSKKLVILRTVKDEFNK